MLNADNFTWAAWFFVRVLSLIYFIAFMSLLPQLRLLLGVRGLASVRTYLDHVKQTYIKDRILKVPTLFWWRADDVFLIQIGVLGCVFSLMAFLGILQSLMLTGTFICYLSFVTVGQDFLSFQWDSLLLEAGFLAIFLAPLTRVYLWSSTIAPPLAILWLLWWLLFRLHFSSGLVKISSRDLSWRKLEAMKYHYETQPLPNPWSWYFHQAPKWFQRFSTVFVFVVELIIPFFIFMPHPFEMVAVTLLLALQTLIIITGNYAFFNFLTIGLILSRIDNASYERIRFISSFETWVTGGGKETQQLLSHQALVWQAAVKTGTVLLSLCLFGLSLVWLWSAAQPRRAIHKNLVPLLRTLLPFHVINTYGLFAVMTTYRPEIIIEGSDDGDTWLPYEFRYKPGALGQRPKWVAPHQPRVDWQMWFAAMDSFDNNIWLQNLFVRLLQGDAEILRLMKVNPFEKKAPAFIRALLYDYRFTNSQERRETKNWWKRQLVIEYSPVVTLAATEDADS